MQAMPAFLWNKRRVFVSHRRSIIRERLWSSVAHQGMTASQPSTSESTAAQTVARSGLCVTQASAPSADVPCNILRHREPHGNRDSDRSTQWRRKTRSDGGLLLCCASPTQNADAGSKHRAGAALDE